MSRLRYAPEIGCEGGDGAASRHHDDWRELGFTTISARLRWRELGWRVWGLAVCPMVGVLVAWLSASRGLTLGEVVLGLIALPAGLAMLGGQTARLSGRRVRRLGADAGVVGITLVLLFYAIVVGSTVSGWFR